MAQCRRAVERHNADLNAFVHLDWAAARAQAAYVDAVVGRGHDPGPLAGVPFGVKDLEHCSGMPTREGCLVYKDAAPASADDPTVARLKAAGAVAVGKTATSEFGIDQATRTRLTGITRNPWHRRRTPGGSSGGSAAAVAAGLVPFATGTDDGGSIRSPAAFSNLVGLKVSHGRIARPTGLSDIGVRGVLTTTVADTARILDVLTGPEPTDKMALPRADAVYEQIIASLPVTGLRAVWSPDLDGNAPVEPEVAAIAGRAAAALAASAGLQLWREPLCLTDPNRIYRPLSNVFVYALLCERGLWPNRLEELCARTRQSALAGARLSLADLLAVQSRRGRLERDIAAIFRRFAVVMTPTVACRPFAAAGPIPAQIAGKDASVSGAEPFTNLANLTWLPAISVPAGFTADGLPVGLQIIAGHHRDDLVLRLAHIWERTQPWPRICPMHGDRLDM